MPSRPKASRPETESKGYLDERPRIFNYERREADPDDFVTFFAPSKNVLKLIEREPRPSPMDHTAAVRADDREVSDLCFRVLLAIFLSLRMLI